MKRRNPEWVVASSARDVRLEMIEKSVSSPQVRAAIEWAVSGDPDPAAGAGGWGDPLMAKISQLPDERQEFILQESWVVFISQPPPAAHQQPVVGVPPDHYASSDGSEPSPVVPMLSPLWSPMMVDTPSSRSGTAPLLPSPSAAPSASADAAMGRAMSSMSVSEGSDGAAPPPPPEVDGGTRSSSRSSGSGSGRRFDFGAF